MRYSRLARLGLILALALIAFTNAAAHHNAGCKWSVYSASQEFGYNYYVRWYFEDPSDFSQNFRSRIQDGATKWNDVDRMLFFGFQSADSSQADLEIKWRSLGWPNANAWAITPN